MSTTRSNFRFSRLLRPLNREVPLTRIPLDRALSENPELTKPTYLHESASEPVARCRMPPADHSIFPPHSGTSSNNAVAIREPKQCAICYEEIGSGNTTKSAASVRPCRTCKFDYHEVCIGEWFAISLRSPIW